MLRKNLDHPVTIGVADRIRRIHDDRARVLSLGEAIKHRGALAHREYICAAAVKRSVDLDEYYRRALLTGYAYHQRDGRGLLPSGLTEEIRVLDQPPLPWDARLARWFDEFVPSPQRVRSYARPSRR